ncbi:MAG: aldehyde dehydrogenase family protein [Alphaproteobacteria bacterium]
MAETIRTISPIDGRIYAERPLADAAAIDATLVTARRAARAWGQIPIAERCALLGRAVDAFVALRDAIAEEITWQIGRPISQSPGEVRGFEERARHMLTIAPDGMADIAVEPKAGFTRFIRRVPLGVVFTIAPWNYPYLTAVNSIIPALAAGNSVILKHSAQTPRCAERFAEAFEAAGLPDGVFQHLFLSHDDTARMIAAPEIDFVCFTGSVEGGHAVQRAAAGRFIGIGLELGGKDPAYVRADADLGHAIENLVDGAFFNSGQSCCAIERIYVHADVYDRFIDGFVALTRKYALGDPRESATNLGPVVRARAAEFVRGQVAEARSQGARILLGESSFPASRAGTPYLGPSVLVDVSHAMRIMSEETFGPAIGIMRVSSDDEAIQLMNDSRYGLTAAIWTADEAAAIGIGDAVQTGTWFMNRCDYLDPALAWAGVKDSGRGCTLSRLGYEHLTRPKSFHLRTRTSA